jgi:hypothetical protein
MKTYGGSGCLTSALDGGEWSASRPCHFTPGERARGILRIEGGGPDAVQNRKKSCSDGNRAQSVQPVARHYTDWAIPALRLLSLELENKLRLIMNSIITGSINTSIKEN